MRNVNSAEKDDLLRFFIRHMSQDQRVLLMATYPLHYKMLYPSVSDASIAFQVTRKLELMENSVNLLPHRNPVL